MKLRKLNRIIHRDLGYFFTGMVIIYALSGIALNHKHDWNPNYIINTKSFQYHLPSDSVLKIDNTISDLIINAGVEEGYKKHYFPHNNVIKIFLSKGSTITYNQETGLVFLEEIKQRPIFYSINFLHFNPGRVWKYFSDFFALSLIIITVSGLILIRGKNGFRWRGFILMSVGLITPIILYFLY